MNYHLLYPLPCQCHVITFQEKTPPELGFWERSYGLPLLVPIYTPKYFKTEFVTCYLFCSAHHHKNAFESSAQSGPIKISVRSVLGVFSY